MTTRLAWAATVMIFVAAAPAFGAPRSSPSTPAFEEPHGADLNQGKPPADIFKSDCSVCHKSPQGLTKNSGTSLQMFLRQHYTTGTPQAAAMAGYLASLGGRGDGPAAKPVSPQRPEKPEKPERPERAQQPSAPVSAARRPAGEPTANDGLTPPERTKPPVEQAVRPPEAVPESKPVETATPSPAAEPAETSVEPAHRRRAAKPEEAAKPEAKPAPAKRAPRIQEAAKPAPAVETPKPAEAATRPPEPAPAPTPPVEAKPAAPAAPQIPL